MYFRIIDANLNRATEGLRNVEEYNQSVPIYKQIQKIHFLEEPGEKTSSGKIKRQNFGGKEDDH